jgi:hypothetical protein
MSRRLFDGLESEFLIGVGTREHGFEMADPHHDGLKRQSGSRGRPSRRTCRADARFREDSRVHGA